MRYENLNQLIEKSSSTRRYFQSLPEDIRLALWDENPFICTAEQLHQRVYDMESCARNERLSGDWF